MLREARDLMATIFLDRRLAALRESILDASVAGAPVDATSLTDGENAIYAEMRDRFFTAEQRRHFEGEAQRWTDDEDFERRTQKLTEYAILMSHRRLAGIPAVHPPFRA